MEIIVRNATLPASAGVSGPVDIGVRGGIIARIAPRIEEPAGREIDASGRLVSPPFCDPHVHLDAALSVGRYGLEEGKPANLLVLDAPDEFEAIRRMPACLYVLRKGKIAMTAQPAVRRISHAGLERDVDFTLPGR